MCPLLDFLSTYQPIFPTVHWTDITTWHVYKNRYQAEDFVCLTVPVEGVRVRKLYREEHHY